MPASAPSWSMPDCWRPSNARAATWVHRHRTPTVIPGAAMAPGTAAARQGQKEPSASTAAREVKVAIPAAYVWVYLMARLAHDVRRRHDQAATLSWEHQTPVRDGVTQRHRVTTLVPLAGFERVDDAIARETCVEAMSRVKQIALVGARKPPWNELAWA